MPLLSKTDIKNIIKYAKIVVVFSVGFVGFIWATFEIYLDDYVQEKIEQHEREIEAKAQ